MLIFFQFFTHDHSWALFCLYDFYVIFLHRGQLWKTHVFFFVVEALPRQKSGVQIVRHVVRPWATQRAAWEWCSNRVFLHFNMNMFSHKSLSWILSSHFQYISNMFKHLWIGLSKKTRGPTCPTILGFLSNRRSDPKSPFLRSKVFRWTRRRRSWIERSQNSFVAICVAKLQTALEMPYQKISDRFVAVGIPCCNATASFRVVNPWFIPGIRLEASFSNGMSGGPFDRDHPMERRRGGNTASHVRRQRWKNWADGVNGTCIEHAGGA